MYDGSCAVGPAVLVSSDPLPSSTEIHLTITRDGRTAFHGTTTLASMKRQPNELVEYLYRDNSFPAGCLLLTGTGIVPPDDFTLASGDEVAIEEPGYPGAKQLFQAHGAKLRPLPVTDAAPRSA